MTGGIGRESVDALSGVSREEFFCRGTPRSEASLDAARGERQETVEPATDKIKRRDPVLHRKIPIAHESGQRYSTNVRFLGHLDIQFVSWIRHRRRPRPSVREGWLTLPVFASAASASSSKRIVPRGSCAELARYRTAGERPRMAREKARWRGKKGSAWS